ncbi:phage tail protein, partial [Campylobacter concisus]|uniref:phage tail protein n=1 Tax=Campylobacter concisus TaxID=199 RepID=UPI0011322555
LYSSNSNTPEGFLRCDGSALDKNTYSALFAEIGYTYGKSGDKFLLPNFSDGKFMRGTGGNAAALGTVQGDAIRNITGSIITRSNTDGSIQAQGAFGGEVNSSWWAQMTRGSGITINFDASRTVPTANENRPYNMAVVVLIKY